MNSPHDIFTHLIVTFLLEPLKSTTKCWHHAVMSRLDNSWPCSGLRGPCSKRQTSCGPTQARVTSTRLGPHRSPQPLCCTPSTPSSTAKNSFHCSQEWNIPMHKWPEQHAMGQMCVWYVYEQGKALFSTNSKENLREVSNEVQLLEIVSAYCFKLESFFHEKN